MKSSEDAIGTSVQALKKQLKQLNKNQLIRLIIDQALAYQFKSKEKEVEKTTDVSAAVQP